MLRTLFRTGVLLVALTHRAGGGELAHGTVRRDTIQSALLGVEKHMQVYLPPSYDTSRTATKRYPVAVYLHGRWGDETDWITLGGITRTMDSLVATGMREMIIVMPDGDDGWWTTWEEPSDLAQCRRTRHRTEPPWEYCVVTPRYDDYLVHEVLPHVDSTYRTIPQRDARGIAGLSMGAYGALAIAGHYPETFSVAVSHGGPNTPGLMADSSTGRVQWRIGRTTEELRVATGPGKWEAQYPMFGLDPATWRARDPAERFRALKARGAPLPALWVDTALDDFLLMHNRVFRDAMVQSGIPLTYTEYPGTHDWRYWRARAPDGLRFIAEHLRREPVLARRE